VAASTDSPLSRAKRAHEARADTPHPRDSDSTVLHLLTAATLLSLGAPDTPPAEPIRVMSFNIRYGTANDGRNHWSQRQDLVADTVDRHQPHVLGVQEALAFQLRFLEDAFPHHRRIGVGREADGGGEHAALFIDERRFEIVESGTFWLAPETDQPGARGWDAALPRVSSWARLRDRTDGSSLLVFNAHFDHRGERARLESARLIGTRVRQETDTPTLVLGDLNAGEDSAPLDALRGSGLRDSFRIAHPDAVKAGTFGAFRGAIGGAKIDYVLVNRRLEVASASIDRTRYTDRDASDHYAVTATVVITPSRGERK
jgi:endonuclease/exonuclease/phosphatase family metal-dependent hydrolase